MEYWIVGPEYSDAEKEFRVLHDTMKRLDMPFDRPGTYNDPLGGNMHISLWGGRYQVHAKSAKHPETLVGEGLHGVILAEAAKLKERVWTKYIRPTLADFSGWSLMTSTPEGKNWFYRMWQAGQDPYNPDWASWRRPSWMNPHVYQSATEQEDVDFALEHFTQHNEWPPSAGDLRIDAEVWSLMRDLSVEMFNQEIGAKFTDFVGRVFKSFDEELHVKPLAFDPAWQTFGAVDYGYTNPSVWLLLQVSPWGEINILDEIYEPGLSPDEFASEIVRRGLAPSGLQAFYPDPASPGDTKILERKLKVRGRPNTGGEIKHRVDAIRVALKPWPAHAPMRPKLLIDPRCKGLIKDMNDYRYPETRDQQDKNAPENPMKKDDHGPEALGRFFAGHMGTPAQGARARARSTEARITRA